LARLRTQEPSRSRSGTLFVFKTGLVGRGRTISRVRFRLIQPGPFEYETTPADLRTPFLFGALAGADLGPNLTPVGALSTMLWLVIVRRRGVEVSAWDFLRLGALVAPLTLIAAAVLVAMSFR
jgi:Arsenical pump membrane protein